MSTQKAFREFERSWSQENLFQVQTKEKIARLEKKAEERDAEITMLNNMIKVQAETIKNLEKDVHNYKVQVYDLSQGKGKRPTPLSRAHSTDTEDRQAAARRKRAQARAAKPQAGLSRSQGTAGLGSVRGKKLVADSLSEQRKREAEAKDKDVQRIEEMLKKLQSPREVDLVSGTSADAAQQAATSATAPRRSVAAAEGSKPASTRGSVAKLILGNPEGRRSAASLGQQSARPSDFGAEDDLGVYDLEVIAARFPHMPLAFVLECERKFIEADNDQSGLVDKSELATIISSSSLQDEEVNKIITKHKLDTEHGLDFLDCLVIYDEISAQQKRPPPKRSTSRTRIGASPPPLESKACVVQ